MRIHKHAVTSGVTTLSSTCPHTIWRRQKQGKKLDFTSSNQFQSPLFSDNAESSVWGFPCRSQKPFLQIYAHLEIMYYCTMQNTDKQSQHSWKLLCGAWLSTECHAPPGSAWQRGAVSPPAILLGSAVSTHVENSSLKIVKTETSLAAHWLRLCTSNAGGVGLIPGWGTKIPHAHMPHGTAKINK